MCVWVHLECAGVCGRGWVESKQPSDTGDLKGVWYGAGGEGWCEEASVWAEEGAADLNGLWRQTQAQRERNLSLAG